MGKDKKKILDEVRRWQSVWTSWNLTLFSLHFDQAHRTLLVRALKGLEDVISLDSTHWILGENGWEFNEVYKDSLFGSQYLKEVYLKANPDFSGRITVPVLWDKKTGTIGMKNREDRTFWIFHKSTHF